MDSNLLKVFVEVAKEKSISKAAITLEYAQSNVTSRVQQLEKSLGYKLFHRVPKGVILTNEGERLYSHAVEIVKKVEIATLDMKNMVHQEQLIVASTESNAVTRIVPFLLKLHEAYPKMQLELITNTTKDIIKQLLEYEVDIAFISGIPQEEELMVLNKVEETIVLVEPKNEEGNNVFLCFKKGCAYNEFGASYLMQTTQTEHKRLEFGSYETILGCVKAGMGKSLLPLSIVEKLNYTEDLKITYLSEETAYLPTCLVCRKDYVPKISEYLKKMKL